MAGKIIPRRVRSLDQADRLPPRPAFELLLPSNRIPRLARGLNVHQAHCGVTEHIAVRVTSFAVLGDAPNQVIGDADVELARVAGENVDVKHPAHGAGCVQRLNAGSSGTVTPSLRSALLLRDGLHPTPAHR